MLGVLGWEKGILILPGAISSVFFWVEGRGYLFFFRSLDFLNFIYRRPGVAISA